MEFLRRVIVPLLVFGIFCACLPEWAQLRSEIESVKQPSKWNESFPNDSFKAVALVCHGLNTKPAKMQSITQFLNAQGIGTILVSLSGHDGDVNQLKQVTQAMWMSDLWQAYQHASRLSASKGVPLYFVGYSLGALINETLMSSQIMGELRYDKQILLAPAISVHSFTHFVLALNLLGKEFIVPSFSPEDYRANQGTSMAAYDSLFDLLKTLQRSQYQNLNIPTLVLIDPADELVSFTGIGNLVDRYQLNRWRIVSVQKKEATVKPVYHHLIIDEASVGKDTWDQITREMSQFLN